MGAGTAPFMAPEMLQERPYSRKVDMWSLGVMAFMMLYGHFPYRPLPECETEAQTVGLKTAWAGRCDSVKASIRMGWPEPRYIVKDGWPEPSQTARRFIQALMERNPFMRPSASKCLQLRAMQQDVEPIPSLGKASSGNYLSGIVRQVHKGTADIKAPVDPTINMCIDDLVERLQEGCHKSWRSSFSLPAQKSIPLSPTRCRRVSISSSDLLSSSVTKAWADGELTT